MRALVAVFLSGVVFALGLGVSGMTDADKVIGFLNLAGAWDPSLAFVMAGAIAVHLLLLRLITQRPGPLFGEEFHTPARGDVDGRLLGGAAIFGVGWALGGFCPGPGVTSGVTLGLEALTFVAAMLVGMAAFHLLEGRAARGSGPTGPVPTEGLPPAP